MNAYESQVHVFRQKLGKLETNSQGQDATARNLFREFFGAAFSQTLQSVSLDSKIQFANDLQNSIAKFCVISQQGYLKCLSHFLLSGKDSRETIQAAVECVEGVISRLDSLEGDLVIGSAETEVSQSDINSAPSSSLAPSDSVLNRLLKKDSSSLKACLEICGPAFVQVWHIVPDERKKLLTCKLLERIYTIRFPEVQLSLVQALECARQGIELEIMSCTRKFQKWLSECPRYPATPVVLGDLFRMCLSKKEVLLYRAIRDAQSTEKFLVSIALAVHLVLKGGSRGGELNLDWVGKNHPCLRHQAYELQHRLFCMEGNIMLSKYLTAKVTQYNTIVRECLSRQAANPISRETTRDFFKKRLSGILPVIDPNIPNSADNLSPTSLNDPDRISTSSKDADLPLSERGWIPCIQSVSSPNKISGTPFLTALEQTIIAHVDEVSQTWIPHHVLEMDVVLRQLTSRGGPGGDRGLGLFEIRVRKIGDSAEETGTSPGGPGGTKTSLATRSGSKSLCSPLSRLRESVTNPNNLNSKPTIVTVESLSKSSVAGGANKDSDSASGTTEIQVRWKLVAPVVQQQNPLMMPNSMMSNGMNSNMPGMAGPGVKGTVSMPNNMGMMPNQMGQPQGMNPNMQNLKGGKTPGGPIQLMSGPGGKMGMPPTPNQMGMPGSKGFGAPVPNPNNGSSSYPGMPPTQIVPRHYGQVQQMNVGPGGPASGAPNSTMNNMNNNQNPNNMMSNNMGGPCRVPPPGTPGGSMNPIGLEANAVPKSGILAALAPSPNLNSSGLPPMGSNQNSSNSMSNNMMNQNGSPVDNNSQINLPPQQPKNYLTKEELESFHPTALVDLLFKEKALILFNEFPAEVLELSQIESGCWRVAGREVTLQSNQGQLFIWKCDNLTRDLNADFFLNNEIHNLLTFRKSQLNGGTGLSSKRNSMDGSLGSAGASGDLGAYGTTNPQELKPIGGTGIRTRLVAGPGEEAPPILEDTNPSTFMHTSKLGPDGIVNYNNNNMYNHNSGGNHLNHNNHNLNQGGNMVGGSSGSSNLPHHLQHLAPLQVSQGSGDLSSQRSPVVGGPSSAISILQNNVISPSAHPGSRYDMSGAVAAAAQSAAASAAANLHHMHTTNNSMNSGIKIQLNTSAGVLSQQNSAVTQQQNSNLVNAGPAGTNSFDLGHNNGGMSVTNGGITNSSLNGVNSTGIHSVGGIQSSGIQSGKVSVDILNQCSTPNTNTTTKVDRPSSEAQDLIIDNASKFPTIDPRLWASKELLQKLIKKGNESKKVCWLGKWNAFCDHFKWKSSKERIVRRHTAQTLTLFLTGVFNEVLSSPSKDADANNYLKFAERTLQGMMMNEGQNDDKKDDEKKDREKKKKRGHESDEEDDRKKKKQKKK